MRIATLSLFACLAAAPAAQAQYLLIANNTTNAIDLHSDFDGSLITAAYIDTVPQTGGNPNDALVVGNEIWVIDQDDDRMYRYSLDGTTYLGDHGVGILNNCRGGGIVGNEVWVTNASGVPGNAVVRFDMAGAHLGNIPFPGSPFDVIPYQGDALVLDFTNDDILRYSAAGAFLSTFHNSDGVTGIDTPEFGTVRANGNVLVGGLAAPSGVYEYGSTGTQVNYYATTQLVRCGAELGNGLIFFTTSSGKFTYNPVGGAIVSIGAGDTKSITRFAGANPPPVPYCFGDGSGTPCPCTPVPLVGDADKGCPNGFNAGGGKLTATGTASIGADTLVMTCTLINNGGAVVFQGTNDNGGGLGTAFGDGLRCAAGTVRRMRSHAVTTNSYLYPDPMFGDNAISIRGAVLAPGDRWYQGWYRSGLAHCDPTQNYNLTNAVKVTWVP